MSGAIKLVAVELNFNREIQLENPKSLRITASLDSPATAMSAVFAPGTPPAPLGAVRAYEDGKLLFEGKADSQKTTVSSGGIATMLEARSAGSLLLDNQAQPCVMLGANLTSVFNRFIEPYGFTLSSPVRTGYLPMYTVRAGMSEWDAFVYFTKRVYGITPYVIYSQVMLQRPPSGARPFVISNSGGAAFSAISHTLTPYNILSGVYLRDEAGFYSSVVNNSVAKRTGTVRKRYVVPPNEYMDKPALDANQRIRKSLFDSEEVVVTLPGVINLELGNEAQITDKLLTLYNLMAVKREYVVDGNGVVTRLTLRSSVYYD